MIRVAITSGAVGEAVAEAWARTHSGRCEPRPACVLERLEEIHRAAQERRDRLQQGLCEALRELAEFGSTRGLVEGVPGAMTGLGFGRSSITWLGGEASDEGSDYDEAARRPDSVRTQVVRRRSAVLVPATRELGDAIAAQWCPQAHVVAPVIVGSGVIGVLYAASEHPLDETDRQIVASFTDGSGHLLARNHAHDELAAVGAALKDLIGRAGLHPGTTSALPAITIPASPEADAAAPQRRASRSSGGPLTPLTPREIETLRYLAAGDTNARIARRLVISEGTVKSHVKNLLRKLGAANRAEAVSVWFQAQAAGGNR